MDPDLQIVREAHKKFGGFYLGGSRRMHEKFDGVVTFSFSDEEPKQVPQRPACELTIPITDATDYDFYVTYSEDLHNYLLDMDFEELEGFYLDNSAVAVLYSGSVQVVLRKDANTYHAMFEDLTADEYTTKVWKSSPTFTGDRLEIQTYINNKLAALITDGRQYGQAN